jgi:hypothetical protein
MMVVGLKRRPKLITQNIKFTNSQMNRLLESFWAKCLNLVFFTHPQPFPQDGRVTQGLGF